jgi:hypothetical protein
MSKVISGVLMILCVTLSQPTFATIQDSVKRKARSLFITPRFNTLNMAPVSGTIVNRHINADVSIVYVKNKFTLTFMDAVDLEDLHSEMNYFFINARYKLKLTEKFSVSPFIAFYSEHAHQLFDIGSDANGGMLFTYQHNSFSVEAFALFVRLTHQNSSMDAVHRFEIKYKFPLMTLSAFVYHNTKYLDDRERVCVGFKALLPEFKLFNKLPARTDVSGSFKVYENPKTTS